MGPSKRATVERFRPDGVGGVSEVTGIEAQTKESKKVAERLVQFKMTQERLRDEEGNMDHLQQQLDVGLVTEAEARMIVARARMHLSSNEAKKQQDEQARSRQTAMAGADYSSANMILEEILDASKQEDESKTLRCLLGLCGLRWLQSKALKERRRRAAPNFVHPFPRLRQVVYSSTFDVVVGAVMLANGMVIGVQASASGSGDQFDVYEHAFTAFFVLEVILRFTVDGWTWIWDRGNLSDFILIVFTGALPMWLLKPAGMENNALLRTFAVLRILRLIRLVRMLRTLPFFRIFWSLIQGILESGRTLLYTYLIITVVLYILAIFAIYMFARDNVFEDDAFAQKYFGDVPTAMFTLFQVITLDGWTEVARPLMKKSDIVVPFFCVVIGVVTLALLNLVVAIIVTNAVERGKQDEALLAVKKREEMENEIKQLTNLFTEIDKDGSGMLSKDEYDDALAYNEDIRTKFDILEIAPSEYQDIWHILDDGTGEVDVERFADLLRSMRGDAKAKDTFSILRRVHNANTSMSKLSQRLDKHRKTAADLRQEATQVRQELGVLQYEMCEFIKLMGQCIPVRPAEVQAKDIEHIHATLHADVSSAL